MEYRGATILATTKDDPKELIMQLRDQKAPTNPGKVGMFGGAAHQNEDLTQTATREFREETGLILPTDRFLLMGYLAGRQNKLALYHVQLNHDEVARMVCLEGERFVRTPFERLEDLPLSSYVAKEVLPKFKRKIARLLT